MAIKIPFFHGASSSVAPEPPTAAQRQPQRPSGEGKKGSANTGLGVPGTVKKGLLAKINDARHNKADSIKQKGRDMRARFGHFGHGYIGAISLNEKGPQIRNRPTIPERADEHSLETEPAPVMDEKQAATDARRKANYLKKHQKTQEKSKLNYTRIMNSKPVEKNDYETLLSNGKYFPKDAPETLSLHTALKDIQLDLINSAQTVIQEREQEIRDLAQRIAPLHAQVVAGQDAVNAVMGEYEREITPFPPEVREKETAALCGRQFMQVDSGLHQIRRLQQENDLGFLELEQVKEVRALPALSLRTAEGADRPTEDLLADLAQQQAALMVKIDNADADYHAGHDELVTLRNQEEALRQEFDDITAAQHANANNPNLSNDQKARQNGILRLRLDALNARSLEPITANKAQLTLEIEHLSAELPRSGGWGISSLFSYLRPRTAAADTPAPSAERLEYINQRLEQLHTQLATLTERENDDIPEQIDAFNNFKQQQGEIADGLKEHRALLGNQVLLLNRKTELEAHRETLDGHLPLLEQISVACDEQAAKQAEISTWKAGVLALDKAGSNPLSGTDMKILTENVGLACKTMPGATAKDAVNALACLRKMNLFEHILHAQDPLAPALPQSAEPGYELAWRIAQELEKTPTGFSLLQKLSRSSLDTAPVTPQVKEETNKLLHRFLSAGRQFVADEEMVREELQAKLTVAAKELTTAQKSAGSRLNDRNPTRVAAAQDAIERALQRFNALEEALAMVSTNTGATPQELMGRAKLAHGAAQAVEAGVATPTLAAQRQVVTTRDNDILWEALIATSDRLRHVRDNHTDPDAMQAYFPVKGDAEQRGYQHDLDRGMIAVANKFYSNGKGSLYELSNKRLYKATNDWVNELETKEAAKWHDFRIVEKSKKMLKGKNPFAYKSPFVGERKALEPSSMTKLYRSVKSKVTGKPASRELDGNHDIEAGQYVHEKQVRLAMQTLRDHFTGGMPRITRELVTQEPDFNQNGALKNVVQHAIMSRWLWVGEDPGVRDHGSWKNKGNFSLSRGEKLTDVEVDQIHHDLIRQIEDNPGGNVPLSDKEKIRLKAYINSQNRPLTTDTLINWGQQAALTPDETNAFINAMALASGNKPKATIDDIPRNREQVAAHESSFFRQAALTSTQTTEDRRKLGISTGGFTLFFTNIISGGLVRARPDITVERSRAAFISKNLHTAEIGYRVGVKKTRAWSTALGGGAGPKWLLSVFGHQFGVTAFGHVDVTAYGRSKTDMETVLLGTSRSSTSTDQIPAAFMEKVVDRFYHIPVDKGIPDENKRKDILKVLWDEFGDELSVSAMGMANNLGGSMSETVTKKPLSTSASAGAYAGFSPVTAGAYGILRYERFKQKSNETARTGQEYIDRWASGSSSSGSFTSAATISLGSILQYPPLDHNPLPHEKDPPGMTFSHDNVPLLGYTAQFYRDGFARRITVKLNSEGVSPGTHSSKVYKNIAQWEENLRMDMQARVLQRTATSEPNFADLDPASQKKLLAKHEKQINDWIEDVKKHADPTQEFLVFFTLDPEAAACATKLKDLSATAAASGDKKAAKEYEKKYRALVENDEVWIEKSIEVPSQDTTAKEKRFRFAVTAGVARKMESRFVVNYLNTHG